MIKLEKTPNSAQDKEYYDLDFSVTVTENEVLQNTEYQTAVNICLKTDARVGLERGFWADPSLGSKVWSLKKYNEAETSDKVKEYINEALERIKK